MARGMGRNLEYRPKPNRINRAQFRATAALLSKALFDNWKTLSKLGEKAGKYMRLGQRKGGATTISRSLIGEIPNRYTVDKPKSDSSDEKKEAK